MVDTLQWTRLHPDYLHRIKVSQCDTRVSHCETLIPSSWYVPGAGYQSWSWVTLIPSSRYVPVAVYKGYARARRSVGLPESAVTLGKFQNGVSKALSLVSCSADSFVMLKYHMIQTIQMCCTGVSTFIAAFNFIGIMLEVGVLNIAAHTFLK